MSTAIVLGYDGTPEARAALPVAVDLAAAVDGRLIIGFGFEPPRMGGEVGALREEIERLGQEFGAEALDQVRVLAPDLVAEVQLVRDRPVETIVRLADAADAAFIVVGHRSRHLLAEVFVGSLLEGVMALTRRPVVVVQADED